MGSTSLLHWVVVLLLAIMIFGTGRIKTIGKDIGECMRSFKEGMQTKSEDEKKE